MFRPTKHIKLNVLTSMPQLHDLQLALTQAQKNRDSTVELPWWLKDVNLSYSLAVRADHGPAAPVWTLYAGEGSKSRVVWSAPFTDLELLKEVVSLTLTESTGSSYSNLPAQVQAAVPAEDIPEQEVLQEIPKEKEKPETAENTQTQKTASEHTPPNENQPAIPYAYFYPGYPYPIPYPYPYPPPVSNLQPPGTIPLQPGMPTGAQIVPELSAPNPELFSKQKTFLLGQFFIDAGLIAADVLKIVLKLQEMIANGVIDIEQAVEQIKKIRGQQGSIEVAELIKKLSAAAGNEQGGAARTPAPLLGEILVKAEIISNSLLVAVLKMQEVVRSGALTQAEASQAIKRQLSASKPFKEQSVRPAAQEESALGLLVRAGLISQDDRETANRVQQKHGGRIDNILVAAGKVSKKTFTAAVECESLLSQNKIKLEQAVIALNYCERSRVGIAEAITDLGWRHDLDL